MTATGTGATHSRSTVNTRGLFYDAAAVLGITALAALVSQPWTGVNSPDSEFYASLALFGDQVAGRALDAAYLWTRLGYIVPVRGLVTTFDPWIGFEVWRWLLIALIVGATYLSVRLVAGRWLATVAATLVALSTMVLGFVGNTYLTGTILAATWLLIAAGCLGCADRLAARWQWIPALVAGASCGWLLMLNPYALGLGGSLWVGIRVVQLGTVGAVGAVGAVGPQRWRKLGRDIGLLIVGAAVSAGVLLLAGLAIFPGRNWLQTYLDWNSRLDYTVFVGDPLIWQRDIALLVPVLAVPIALVALWASRNSRWAWVSLSLATMNLAFTAVFMLAVPGPWLEAQHYVAKLWPAALMAIVLAFAAVLPEVSWSLRPTWVGPAAVVTGLGIGIPAMLWSGRWELTLSMAQGVALSAVALLGAAISFLLARSAGSTRGATPIIVVFALVLVFVCAQLLQNGRGALGIYRQYPLRAAYVDYQMREQMASKIALEQWLLARTTDSDRIGLWTDPERLTGEVAAMQLWGYYNLISTNPTLTRDESKILERIRPSAIAMYAPTRPQIETFAASLPPWGRPSELECTSQPFLGIGSEQAWLCLTHLRWVG